MIRISIITSRALKSERFQPLDPFALQTHLAPLFHGRGAKYLCVESDRRSEYRKVRLGRPE